MRKILKGIAGNILLLGMVSFLNDASSEIIKPILPFFIVALGGTEVIIGLISGVMESVSSILKVVFGYLSDKLGERKIFVSSGYIFSAIFKLLLGFSCIWQHILLFAGLERVGKGLRTAPRDAIIADSLPEKKGRGFGIHRALDTLGAIVGASLAFAFLYFLRLDFRTMIFISAMMAFLSLIPMIWVRERKAKRRRDPLTFKPLDTSFKLFIFVSSLFALSNISYMFFIRKAQLLCGGEDISLPVLLYVLFNVFYAGFAAPFGILSDRIGKDKVLIAGYALFSLVCLGFALSKSFYHLIPLFILYGISYAIVEGNQRALVSDLSSKSVRGTALGIFHTTTGILALPAGLMAGILWDRFAPWAPFLFSAVLSSFSSILFAIIRRRITHCSQEKIR